MCSDVVEEILDEELIEIMMRDQKNNNNEGVAIEFSPAAPLPLETEVYKMPSPRPSPCSSPCHSPVHFMPRLTEAGANIKGEGLSPISCTKNMKGTSMQMPRVRSQRECLTPKLGLSMNKPSSICKNIEIDDDEDSKVRENSKMGDKARSRTMSDTEMTSFQKRLFGLQQPAAHSRKSHTLPLTSKAITTSKRLQDLPQLDEPIPSLAIVSNGPLPPPEPKELKYFECDEVKMRHLVTMMGHANACTAMMCLELCVYIKWFANHRRTCSIIYTNKGTCNYCHQFMQWQYQHCVDCKCCPSKGCSDNISWCPLIKQSILKNKLENCIAPVVRKLKNGCSTDKENSCPRQDVIEKCHPEEYLHLMEELKEHLYFNAGGGQFVEGEHWKKNKLAGCGRAGSCWIAELLECPFYFAVKEAKLDSNVQARRNLDEAYCSVKMNYLSQHVCPNIIDYYGFTAVCQPIQNPGCFMDQPPLLLQIHMELMACCLQSFVTDKDKNGPLLFDKVVDFSYQLFSALDFLHSSLRILHRDIKPGNILVAHNEQRIKLTDFDCAALLDEWNLCDVFHGDPQGTVHYNPPELYRHGQSSWSLDVWQVACCVLFMCTGCRPWRHAYSDCDLKHPNRKYIRSSMQQKISTYQRHLLPGFLPPTLHSLLSKCLQSDWSSRLTSMDALYLLDPDVKSRTKLLSNHDITGPPCTVSTALTQNDSSHLAVDLYLAEFTETMSGRYLQPGWIGSVNVSHNKTITYGDVKKLIYNSTELEVMRYLVPCNFYIYKNDRIKIRDLLIKERTLDGFDKMNDSDIVDPSNAIIMHYMG